MLLVEDKIGSMLEGISDVTERNAAAQLQLDLQKKLQATAAKHGSLTKEEWHTELTYERHYKRVVPARVTTAARQHPLHGELTADEVLFL